MLFRSGGSSWGFAVEHDGTYLMSHSIGLPVRGSREVASGFFDHWEQHTSHAWDHWLGGIEDFRDALAHLLSTETRLLCPQSNVSSGLTKVLGAVRHALERPTVLISEDAFPSLGFVCRRSGYDVRFVPADVDVSDPTSWADHLDGLDVAVDVAVVTHVHSNTGVCVPVTEDRKSTRLNSSHPV